MKLTQAEKIMIVSGLMELAGNRRDHLADLPLFPDLQAYIQQYLNQQPDPAQAFVLPDVAELFKRIGEDLLDGQDDLAGLPPTSKYLH